MNIKQTVSVEVLVLDNDTCSVECPMLCGVYCDLYKKKVPFNRGYRRLKSCKSKVIKKE